jgi:hypothetical protein
MSGKAKKPSLYSKKTEWNCFRETLDELITLEIPLRTEIDIEEAVENITKAIKEHYGKQHQIETNKTLKKSAQ